MSQAPKPLWIHIGHCPICNSGLCRIRACGGADSQPHLYAMCDECESLWLQPTTSGEDRIYADMDNPKCPVCSLDLYGQQADWASLAAIKGSAWEAAANLENADPKPGAFPNATDEDLGYGQDEPRPGC